MANSTKHLWGFSTKLYLDDRIMLTRMWAGEGGGASSLHLHERRHNLFQLSRGVIIVSVEEFQPGKMRHHYLRPGHAIMVPAGQKHRLTVVEPMEGVELYLASDAQPIDPGDIHRFDEGWRPGDKREE
jgi:mannose-6-phosphate isomerase-like protein (cupin superfamily)